MYWYIYTNGIDQCLIDVVITLNESVVVVLDVG